MPRGSIRIKDITIPNGAAVSNIIDCQSEYFGLGSSLSIAAPATLDVLTFTVEASLDGSLYSTLTGTDGTTALPLPAAGKVKTYQFEFGPIKSFRIKSSGNVAADRTFQIAIQEFLSA